MNMIKMVIVPLVFSSLVIGVCSLGDIKKVGRIGVKTVAYYMVTTAFAIVIGLAMGEIFQPAPVFPCLPKLLKLPLKQLRPSCRSSSTFSRLTLWKQC